MSAVTRSHKVDFQQSIQMPDTRFMWLEITGKCQLECVHCYANSGPQGAHSPTTTPEWEHVITQGRELGVEEVQFIGGEPTLHPDLGRLIEHALAQGLRVEVFSNLVHIKPVLWDVFTRPGVSLATSYYSDLAGEHESITRRRGSHGRTMAGIVEALRRDIPLRVGVIGVQDGQNVDEACRQLAELGVVDIGVDYLRQVGRGVRDAQPDTSQLCGNCAKGVLAISPSGEVWPCVFTRWMPIGNIREQLLKDIVRSSRAQAVTLELDTAFKEREKLNEHVGACAPQCTPTHPCAPNRGPNCGPAGGGSGNCNPRGGGPCAPKDKRRPSTG